jgi:hypothetical protein
MNMATKVSAVLVTFSAWFATFLSVGYALFAANKFSIWDQLKASECFWTIFAFVYAVVLTSSGWSYRSSKSFAFGLLHALMMFGIAGFVIYIIVKEGLYHPGKDNAAAGILAAANLVVVAIGALAAFCAITVTYSLFSGKRSISDKLSHP